MQILKDLKYVFLSLIGSLIVFALVSLLLLSVQPRPDSYLTVILNSYKAGKWVETPCLIISSKVSSENRSSTKSHGKSITYTIYYPDIAYSYKVNNIDYKSSRYNFLYFLSEDEVKTIVKEYTPEKKTVCYVNPSRPEEVVLNPETPDKVFNRIIKQEPGLYYVMLIFFIWSIFMPIMGLFARKTLFRNSENRRGLFGRIN